VARFEGGAQGEHKMARALLPVQTTSAHWLAHPAFADAVARFLAREDQGWRSTWTSCRRARRCATTRVETQPRSALGLRRTARAAGLVHHRRELRRLEGLGRRAAVLVGHAEHHVGTGAEALGHGLVQLQRHVHRRWRSATRSGPCRPARCNWPAPAAASKARVATRRGLRAAVMGLLFTGNTESGK
jgi:hypothetical protein